MASALYQLAYAIAYTTFALGVLSSLARFYSRALLVKSWGWDDTASCAVLLVNIAHQVVLQLFLNLGCGRSGNVRCTFESLDLVRTAFIEEIVFYGAHFIVKTTFLLFYLRLSPGQTFRRFVYLGFALNCAVCLSSMLLTVLQCIPFEKILNPLLHPEVKCVDTRSVMLTPPVLNIVMDFYILCVPIKSIWTLQMTLRRKVTILSVLTFGLVYVTVAIIRLPVLVSVTSTKTDASVNFGRMIIVAAFEVQCAIFAVNLPSLTSLWTQIRGRLSSAGSRDPSSQRPYILASTKSDSRKRVSMGSITRLEKGHGSNESEEELLQWKKGQIQSQVEEMHAQHDRPNGSSRMGYGKHNITVTNNVDVQHHPVART